jgi:hypothetical protein
MNMLQTTSYGLDGSGFESRKEQKIFLISKTFRSTLRTTQPLVQWVPGHFLGIKQPGHEVNHSPTPSAEIKNVWSYTSAHPICHHGLDREQPFTRAQCDITHEYCLNKLSFGWDTRHTEVLHGVPSSSILAHG